MMTDRILGYAPLDGLDALLALLNTVPGPAVEAWHGSRLAAVLQSEPEEPPFCRQRIEQDATLLAVQRRLQLACHAGRFLPQDPEAATVPSDAVPSLLATAWSLLDTALNGHGNYQQWDVVLRWSAEVAITRNAHLLGTRPSDRTAAIRSVLQGERQRQEARLLNTLSRAVLALANDGSHPSDTSLSITALVEVGREHAMEAVLETLEDSDLFIELRGPMPPLAFAAVRVVATEAIEINGAWSTLSLGEYTNRAQLEHQWRTLAASIRPAHQAHRLSGAMPGIAGLTDAYRLLRPLLRSDGATATLSEVLRHAGHRLLVPDAPAVVRPPLAPRTLALAL